MDKENLRKAIELRHQLHMYPELSEHEYKTKETLMSFLKENTSLKVVDRGLWFYAKYESPSATLPSLALRADFDAIKVFEDNSLPYASKNPGVAHKCGHDGHSSALCAYALDLDASGADRDIYLIFQHAEEVGSGAKECAKLIDEENISEVYGVHNYPGKPFGTVCTCHGTVNFASVGIEYTLTGTPTHASTPELGRNPAKAVARMILAIDEITASQKPEGVLLATVIQVDLGERAFGVSASQAKLLLTVRGEFGNEMDAFIEALNNAAGEFCHEDGLDLNVEYFERFPDTYNHPAAVDKIMRICNENNIEYEEMPPLRTSEDFGEYTAKAPGALIWLGAGENWPPLHDKSFDYNDALIEETSELFKLIATAPGL